VDERHAGVETDRLDATRRRPAGGCVDERDRRHRYALLLQQTERTLRELHIRLEREGRRGVTHLDDDRQGRGGVGGHALQQSRVDLLRLRRSGDAEAR
jgi:hypothetical protein